MKTDLSHPRFQRKKKEPFLLSSKFIAVFFVVSLLLPLLALAVFSHPGRTDSYGGHYNRSTGEYHYHHGYPAHQHTDGVCPYDYDNKTASKSSPGSSRKHTTEEQHAPMPTKNKSTENKTTESQADNKRKDVAIVIIGVVIVVAAFCEIKNK